MKTKAERIVESILDNLSGRSGIEMHDWGDDIIEEMTNEMVEKTNEIMGESEEVPETRYVFRDIYKFTTEHFGIEETGKLDSLYFADGLLNWKSFNEFGLEELAEHFAGDLEDLEDIQEYVKNISNEEILNHKNDYTKGALIVAKFMQHKGITEIFIDNSF